MWAPLFLPDSVKLVYSVRGTGEGDRWLVTRSHRFMGMTRDEARNERLLRSFKTPEKTSLWDAWSGLHLEKFRHISFYEDGLTHFLHRTNCYVVKVIEWNFFIRHEINQWWVTVYDPNPPIELFCCQTNLSGCVKTTEQCSVSTWKVRIWCGERECFPPCPAPRLPTQLSSMHLQNGDWAPGRHTGRRQSAGTSARITVVTAPDTREHCRHHNLRPEDLKRFKESDG